MTGFFDIKDKKGGTLYLFKGGNPAREINFTLKDDFTIVLQGALPSLEESFLSVPVSLLNFRVLEFPFGETDKIRQALPFELEGLILKNVQDLVMDAYAVSETETSFKVMAVYAEKSVLLPMIDSLRAVKADPRVITSLDLRYIKDSGKDLSEALLANEIPEGEERIKTAGEEIANPLINLRRGELSYTKEKEQTTRSVSLAIKLSALILIVISAYSGIKTYRFNTESRAIMDSMRESYRKAIGQYPPAGVSPATILKSKIKEASMRKEMLGGLPALRVWKDLTELRLKQTVFNEVDMDANGILVKGEAPSLSDVETQRNAMLKKFSSAQVVETRTSADKVNFTLSMKL